MFVDSASSGLNPTSQNLNSAIFDYDGSHLYYSRRDSVYLYDLATGTTQLVPFGNKPVIPHNIPVVMTYDTAGKHLLRLGTEMQVTASVNINLLTVETVWACNDNEILIADRLTDKRIRIRWIDFASGVITPVLTLPQGEARIQLTGADCGCQ